MLGVLQDFPEQCKEAIRLVRGIKIKDKFSNICVCGMGGSGIGGDLLKPLAKKTLIFAHHTYGLPSFVNNKSLVICVSYSGNTEEVLSAYAEAKKRKAKIISITSGGKLAGLDKNTIIIPKKYKDFQPRSAIGYLFLTMVAVLSSNGLIPSQSAAMNEAVRILHPKQTSKEAFMIAKKLYGMIPVFYASNDLGAVAYRMKTQINENAKHPAFYHVFPEMDHNEINGFRKLGKKIVTVFIRDKKDLIRVRKRMAVTKKLIKGSTNTIDIHVRGNSLLARMLTTIYLGDFASYYLALMNKIDPTPVDIVEDLKKKL